MQLARKPFIDAHGSHSIEVAGARTEGEPVQGMQDPFVTAQLAGLVGLPDRRLGGTCPSGSLRFSDA
jgi:hypothetical protein